MLANWISPKDKKVNFFSWQFFTTKWPAWSYLVTKWTDTLWPFFYSDQLLSRKDFIYEWISSCNHLIKSTFLSRFGFQGLFLFILISILIYKLSWIYQFKIWIKPWFQAKSRTRSLENELWSRTVSKFWWN